MVSYKEYRRSVKRYTKLVGKPGAGLALQLNLSGEALDITKTLSARRLKDKDGVALLLDTLDDEYLGLQEDRLDEVAEEFVTCCRQHGESIRRLKETRRELEDEDDDMYVSEKFFSWMLLRRSGLSVEEKSRVRSEAHCSEDPRDLAFALKRLFPSQRIGFNAIYDKRPGNPGRHPGSGRQAFAAANSDDAESDSDDALTGDDLELKSRPRMMQRCPATSWQL